MENQVRVVCPENEELAAFLWRKRQEMAEQPKGISENIDLTLYRAYSNVCRSEVPVKTLKEFSQIKWVIVWFLGNWESSGKGICFFLTLHLSWLSISPLPLFFFQFVIPVMNLKGLLSTLLGLCFFSWKMTVFLEKEKFSFYSAGFYVHIFIYLF